MSYEDFLAVRVEYAKPITKAEAKSLAALYEGWKTRVTQESRKIAKADGEELLPIRFDGLGISGVHANGGASRFLSADGANAWLAKQLSKIAKVTFGDEDVPAAPKAGRTRERSPAAQAMRAALAAVLGEESKNTAVFGCISIRFTGEKLPSPTRVLAKIIEEAVAQAGDIGSIWVRGTWGKSGSLEEVNQGRDLREKNGRALLERILGDVPKMPKTAIDSHIVHLVLSDGPRPERTKGYWVDGSRIAATLGIQITLEPMERRGLGGHIEIYVPLEELDSWIALGDRAFAALHGSIGTFSPALWMEAIRPSSLPIGLFAKLPSIAIPRIVGRHAGGFTFPDFAPDLHHGLFEPPWIAWLPNGKKHRIEDAAPLEMNDARYRKYQKAWAALEPFRIRWTEDEDGAEAWRRALDRFDAPSFGELEGYLERQFANAKRREKLYWSCRAALDQHDGKKAFEEATEALELGEGPRAHDVILAAILCYGGKGKPSLALAPKALAAAGKLAPRLRARVYLELGDRKAALAALDEANGDDPPDPLERDPAFAPLYDEPRFRRAFGWASVRPASVKTVAAAEKALGVKFPAEYREFLAKSDGVIFHHGREFLYGIDELVARNVGSGRHEGQLKVGRNLVLGIRGDKYEIEEEHYGLRTPGTTLRWKKLSACLKKLSSS